MAKNKIRLPARLLMLLDHECVEAITIEKEFIRTGGSGRLIESTQARVRLDVGWNRKDGNDVLEALKEIEGCRWQFADKWKEIEIWQIEEMLEDESEQEGSNELD